MQFHLNKLIYDDIDLFLVSTQMSEIQLDEQPAIQGLPTFSDLQLVYNQPIGSMAYTEKSKKGREFKNAPPEFNYAPENASLYTLKNVVSSKNARDIVRSTNFMPGQFDVWNSNPKGGNNKYTGRFEDLDGDDIPEYVIKRDGKLVAINGYTTKKSDFPFKAEYYRTHPNPESRKEESYNVFLRDRYYGPQYTPDGSAITKWNGRDPTDEEFRKKYKRHNTHQPRPLSTYQAFSKFIVAKACQEAFKILGDRKPEKQKIARKIACQMTGFKMFEASITSITYATIVKVKILESLSQSGELEKYQNAFLIMKAQSTPGFHLDFKEENVQNTKEYKAFEDWLFNQAVVKSAVQTYMKSFLTTDRAQYIRAIAEFVVGKLKSIPGYEKAVNDAWEEKKQYIDDIYDMGYHQE